MILPDADGAINTGSAASDPVVTRLLGTGPWAWQGVAPFGFLRDGLLYTPWGAGSWGAHATQPNTIFANFVR